MNTVAQLAKDVHNYRNIKEKLYKKHCLDLV